MVILKPRSHCPGFQYRCHYTVDTGAHRDHAVATPASTVLIGIHRVEPAFTGKWHRWFSFFNWTYRDAKHRGLIPGHQRSPSGMSRYSTVTPPGETVANRHELCPRWRYRDSQTCHGVSRRRADVVSTI